MSVVLAQSSNPGVANSSGAEMLSGVAPMPAGLRPGSFVDPRWLGTRSPTMMTSGGCDVLEFLRRLFRRRPDPSTGNGSFLRARAGQERAEEGLRQSEEHFAQLVAGVRDYAVFLLDRQGNIRTGPRNGYGLRRSGGHTGSSELPAPGGAAGHRLPKMSGYEAARHIRRQPWGKGMALIALTGWGQEEDKLRALEAGFDHHLTKPVEATDLEKLLAVLNPVTQG
jgi:hypothetical protein